MSIYKAPYISAKKFLHNIDPTFDLVSEAEWEDSPCIEFISLESAGLEEGEQPVFGLSGVDHDWRHAYNNSGSVNEYVSWFYDNEDCRNEI